MTDLAGAVRRLESAGVPSPRFDAKALLAHAAGDLARFEEYVGRRAAREPLQHITGSVGFRYVEVLVGPGVFVPRPETEVVAGWAIEALRGLDAPVVVDLCTGSGAIAKAVAHEVPGAVVHAVEKDPAALAWARRNLPHVHEGDARDAFPELDGTVDLVISNPPYLCAEDLELVEPEVRDHDPLVALVAGGDGLDVIRDVAATAYRLLKPGGHVVVEHSDRQGETAPEVLRRTGFHDVEDHLDLTGRPRFATGRT